MYAYYCSNVCFNYLEETLSCKTNLFVLFHWGDSSHAKLLSSYLYLPTVYPNFVVPRAILLFWVKTNPILPT